MQLPMQPPMGRGGDWGLYTFWRTAPTSCRGAGWTLLGELGKLISVSPQRIEGVASSCGAAGGDAGGDSRAPSMSVHIVGSPGEVVALSFVEPAPSTAVQTVEATLGHDGVATVACASRACAQATGKGDRAKWAVATAGHARGAP